MSGRRTFYISIAIVVVAIVIIAGFFSTIPLSKMPSTSSSTQSGISSSSSSTTSSTDTTTTSTSSSQSTTGLPNSFAGDWLTYHYDNSRSGYNASVPLIGSPKISWKANVSGQVYAAPLYYNGMAYIATENDTVYGLSIATGSVVWSRNLGAPVNSFVSPFECNNNPFNAPDIRPWIGITGTPVIDPSTQTIYVPALISGVGFRLFALNTNNGSIRWNASVTSSGFNYEAEEERGALVLANGMVYIPFGGYSWDCSGPNGWIIAISANGNGTTFHYLAPANPEGDIWEPEGISADSSGYIYAVTGDSANPTFDYGNSVLKLSPQLSLLSYFAASDWNYTNNNDIDLSSTGATLLSGNLAFSIGKDGIGYLLNTSDLGGIGGELYSATVCGTAGAWGSTSYVPPGVFGTQEIIYVPCATGLDVLKVNSGSSPSFSSFWNYTGFWATPPIIAFGAVWTLDVYSATLYAFSPTSNKTLFSLPPLISPGNLPHFTTPAAGGGQLLFTENSTVVALAPA